MQHDSASWNFLPSGQGSSAHLSIAPDPEDVRRQIQRLHADFSAEITPRDAADVDLLARILPPGTRIYITHLPGPGLDGTAVAAKALADRGLSPVPHMAVRSLTSLEEADQALARMSQEAGVTEVLVIGGGLAAAGPLASTVALLDTGVLARHGITTIGVAGHPEGASDISPDDLALAIAQKNAYAAQTGAVMKILTQFTFDPTMTVLWERQLRAAGNRLPIHVGLPGAASLQKLINYGIRCGIGPSLSVLRKQSGKLLKLASASAHYPDATIAGVAAAAALDSESLFRAFHYFPFGALEQTLAWAEELRTGAFSIDRRGRILTAGRPS